MANPNPNLFYFYRRYRWRAADFTAMQQYILDIDRGSLEGEFKSAVLSGFEVLTSGGLQLNINPGIASGPTGYFHAVTVVKSVTPDLPASGGRRSLIVARPLLQDNTIITNPTAPFNQVPLNQFQGTQLLVINGTDSLTPDYPAKGPNDVVLAGVKLFPGQSVISQNQLDFEIRDLPIKNARLGQNTLRYDNRLRPYRNGFNSVGIKPSQTDQSNGSDPKMFLFAGKGTPSLFPLTAGVFTPADSFLNFSTGAITGGDGTSPDFTPQFPTAGNSIVATVILTTTDQIQVFYGTQGTYDQCVSGIINQTTVGTGSIDTQANAYKICYVIVSSLSGVLSDIQVFDARTAGGANSSVSTPVINEKNYLLNSAFDFWQRFGSAASQAIPHSGTIYVADQWYGKNPNTVDALYSAVAGSLDGSKFGARVKVNGSTGVFVSSPELVQVLENFDTLELLGKSISAGVQIKAVGNVNQIGLSIVYNTAEAKYNTVLGAEALVTVNSGGFTLASILNRLISSGTVGTAGSVGLRIRATGVSSGSLSDNGNGFIAEQAQLNLGSTLLPFWTRAASSIADELDILQRYFESSFDVNTAPADNSTGLGEIWMTLGPNNNSGAAYTGVIPYKKNKRVTPNLTFYNASTSNTGTWRVETATAAADSTPTIQDSTTWGFNLVFNGNTLVLAQGGFSADAAI